MRDLVTNHNSGRETKWSIQRITTLAMLFALLLILQWVEHLLPPPLFIPAPIHYGLANIVIMFVLLSFDWQVALLFTSLKCFTALLLRGLLAGMLSGGGSLLALLVMLLFKRLSKVSVFLLSVIGAIAHNIGQLVVLLFFQFNLFAEGVRFLLAPLIFFGCLTGLLSGGVLRMVLPVWQYYGIKYGFTADNRFVSHDYFKCGNIGDKPTGRQDTTKQTKHLIQLIAIGLSIVMSVSAVACKQTVTKSTVKPLLPKQHRDFTEYFDTLTTLVGKDLSLSDFTYYTKLLEAELGRYHRLYHSFKLFPEVTNPARINRLEVGAEIDIDRDLYDLLTTIFHLQAGYEDKVNVLAGDLLQLWQEAIKQQQLPTPQSLASVKAVKSAQECFQLLPPDSGHKTYRLRKLADVKLELGAIAKGFAMYKIAEALTEKGAHNLLLSVGGDICAIGDSTVKWSAAIVNPLKGLAPSVSGQQEFSELVESMASPQALQKLQNTDWLDIVPLTGQALVTSGVYERYMIKQGHLFHHIVDLETKQPEYRYLSISVAGDDIVVCDWLATLFFNCQLKEIETIIREYPEYSFLIIDKELHRYGYGKLFVGGK